MSLSDGDDTRVYPDGKRLPDQPHWQKDFPTDIPDDDHVARREFVKFLVLTSGAFVAGQCWIAAASALRREGPFPRTRIATVAELESRQVVEFRYPDEHEPCLALCLGPGRYVAYGQKCTHLACAVVPHLDRGELHCPCHNGFFEANDGRPIAGPPRRPLPLVRLEVQGDEVFATGVELRTV
ncbi:MAG TPA: Rieske 2Fe-2S domain-containing protein [Fimbriiglobus sp.]|jgi:nitrite reductase/ring-hydroxylating ferredoxin subunit|nr:Rieske 2Fe-2S domain-containing protein [Fimbriiglobus sp.]